MPGALKTSAAGFGQLKRWVLSFLLIAVESASGVLLAEGAYDLDAALSAATQDVVMRWAPAPLTLMCNPPWCSLAIWCLLAFHGIGYTGHRLATLYVIPTLYLLDLVSSGDGRLNYSFVQSLNPMIGSLHPMFGPMVFLAVIVFVKIQTFASHHGFWGHRDAMPLGLLECPPAAGDNTELVIAEHSKHNSGHALEGDVSGSGRAPGASGASSAALLLRGFWPLSPLGHGPQMLGAGPAAPRAPSPRVSCWASMYAQAYDRGLLNGIGEHVNASLSSHTAPTAGASTSTTSSSRGPPPGTAPIILGGVAPAPGPVASPPEGASIVHGDASAVSKGSTDGSSKAFRPVIFTSTPQLRPGSSGVGPAKASGRPVTQVIPEIEVQPSESSAVLIPALRIPSSYPLGETPITPTQDPIAPITITSGQQLLSADPQEAAAPTEPKLEKQGSGIKKGLQKMKSGMKEMKEKVKGQTTPKRQNKHAVITGPTPVHTPSPAVHELQRGNSLKDRLKRKLSPSRKG